MSTMIATCSKCGAPCDPGTFAFTCKCWAAGIKVSGPAVAPAVAGVWFTPTKRELTEDDKALHRAIEAVRK